MRQLTLLPICSTQSKEKYLLKNGGNLGGDSATMFKGVNFAPGLKSSLELLHGSSGFWASSMRCLASLLLITGFQPPRLPRPLKRSLFRPCDGFRRPSNLSSHSDGLPSLESPPSPCPFSFGRTRAHVCLGEAPWLTLRVCVRERGDLGCLSLARKSHRSSQVRYQQRRLDAWRAGMIRSTLFSSSTLLQYVAASGKPAAYNYGLLCLKTGLLLGVLVDYFLDMWLST